MNASLLLLSSAFLAGADPMPPAAAPAAPTAAPVVVTAPGCSGCGAAVHATATFASVSLGAAACEPGGSDSKGLFARLRARFHKPAKPAAADCGLTVVASPCGTPACGPALPSSFVASNTATAGPSCCGPVVKSSFVIGTTGCCDPAPCATCGGTAASAASAPHGGLFSRLRARLSGKSASAKPTTGTTGCSGCTPTVGTVIHGPATPSVPVPMPPPETPKPKDPKDPVKDKTSAVPAPVVPLVPSDLPRIPTLSGPSGN